MINTNKKFITLFISATINILFCQSDVDVSRTTAITRAIEKV